MEEQRQPLVLINAFEVPPEADDEFIRGWEAARDYLQTQPGYRYGAASLCIAGCRLPLRQRRPPTVAAAFHAAIQSPGFREASQGLAAFRPHPELYEVVYGS